MDAGTDKAYDTLRSKTTNSEKAKNVLRGAGYARGGGVSPMKAKKIADKEVHKHEKHDHADKKETKLKQGGHVEGKASKSRADKFARGGKAPHGKHTKININVGASQADKAMAAQQGAKLGAQLMAQKLAGGGPRPGAGAPMQARPQTAPPAPGGMPPGGPGGVPPTMQARGGRTFAKGGKVTPLKMEHGAGGGEGRLEKARKYGTKPKT